MRNITAAIQGVINQLIREKLGNIFEHGLDVYPIICDCDWYSLSFELAESREAALIQCAQNWIDQNDNPEMTEAHGITQPELIVSDVKGQGTPNASINILCRDNDTSEVTVVVTFTSPIYET